MGCKKRTPEVVPPPPPPLLSHGNECGGLLQGRPCGTHKGKTKRRRGGGGAGRRLSDLSAPGWGREGGKRAPPPPLAPSHTPSFPGGGALSTTLSLTPHGHTHAAATTPMANWLDDDALLAALTDGPTGPSGLSHLTGEERVAAGGGGGGSRIGAPSRGGCVRRAMPRLRALPAPPPPPPLIPGHPREAGLTLLVVAWRGARPCGPRVKRKRERKQGAGGRAEQGGRECLCAPPLSCKPRRFGHRPRPHPRAILPPYLVSRGSTCVVPVQRSLPLSCLGATAGPLLSHPLSPLHPYPQPTRSACSKPWATASPTWATAAAVARTTRKTTASTTSR